ncbi:hypothetical protein JAAARDRAFT_191378 [Jaapia argillacea MUCL 33604]|uniref:Terpene synthase n=1 Tax=Jaapia argillacea MUCL 33604 TaxID=933084 RepID=A0A067QCQ2_9AGAM|nr:hypothetical protein JAAARDRAFT_191378 [Jaapia argillacea MUCL 33604]
MPVPTSPSESPSLPLKFRIPDFISYSGMKVKVNRHYKRAAADSERWIVDNANIGGSKLRHLRGSKGGLLAAMCYPSCDYTGLRLASDFMCYLFHLDDMTDGLSENGQSVHEEIVGAVHQPSSAKASKKACKLTTEYWVRLSVNAGAPENAQRYYAQVFDDYLKSVYRQAHDRASGVIPDLESYIALRRDTSACRPCFALTSCSYRLDIPLDVMNHPIVQNLDDAANDLVTWSNDIFSYNVEQSRGDTHNMLVVVMRDKGCTLQEAVDFVGGMTKQSIDRFHENRTLLPSWTPEIDEAVATYVDGLENWIIGSLYWSFESQRYFLQEGRKVKSSKIVTLLPRRA